MIFKLALRRELSRNFGATLVILATIVMTMMLIRTLGLASKGAVNPQEVLLIMAYSVIGHTPTILALSLFIAVVSTLARMIAESEVVIWFSSGKSIIDFVKPLLQFGTPIFITIALMAFMIWPWANAQMQHLRERFEQRGDLERISPGEFQESSNGKRIIYIDKYNSESQQDMTAHNIFMAYFDQGKELITSAQSGHTEVKEGARYIVLIKGQQLAINTVKQDVQLTEFETMGNLVGATDMGFAQGPPNTRTTLSLLSDPRLDNQGELSWRIGIVLASINLILLALASAHTKPRATRGGHLLFAMLVFVPYYNFINIGQNWIASGRISLLAMTVLLHGSVCLASVAWLARRHFRP